MSRRWFVPLSSLLVLLALGLYVALNFSVTSDVSALLPPDADGELLSLTRRVADGELGRTMVLTVTAKDTETACLASEAFEQALRADPRIAAQLASLDAGPAEGTERAVYELYHPRRLGFFAPGAEAARSALQPKALTAAAKALKERLAQPMSPLVSLLAPSDPTLVLARLFERLQQQQGQALHVERGRFVGASGRFAVLFLRTHAAGFDADAQAPVLAGVTSAFEHVNARFEHGLHLDMSGVNRFAVRAKAAISADIERVSTLSTAGFFVLLLVLFRSVRLAIAASVPLFASFVTGCAAVLAVYGRLHGITLAFGSSLLGVALDYVEHLYCHQAVLPHPQGVRGTLRSIAPALVTGAGTTLIGFAALGGSGFRGLEEVALFSSAGLIGALLSVFALLPPILPDVVPEVPLRTRLVARLARAFNALHARRRFLWVPSIIAVVVAAVGLPRVKLSDDFTLGQVDSHLLAEDQRVRSRVMRFDQMRFVAAVGDDDESALETNDRVAASLRDAVAHDELSGFLSASDLLPSVATQRAVIAALQSGYGNGDAFHAAFEGEGFRPDAFGPFEAAVAQPPKPPLTYAEVAASPLAPLVRPLRIPLSHGVAFLTFLRGVKDVPTLAKRLAPIERARFVDQQAMFHDTHRAYLIRTAEFLVIGSLGVLLLLLMRYRDLRRTLASFLPSALSAAVTVAMLALLGRKLDLVALAALLMVISMGVDYGVFLVDAQDAEEEPSTALLSVFFAATTSVAGFGLLALSQHPMLSLIGLTAFVGMTLCTLLSPTTLVLLGRGQRGEHEQQSEKVAA